MVDEIQLKTMPANDRKQHVQTKSRKFTDTF